MSTYRVVILDDRFGTYSEEEKVLMSVNASIDVCDFNDDLEAINGLRDADGVLVNLFPLTATIIEGMKKCRIISRYGVGYDNVDVDAATRAGIWVARVPDYGVEDVSDHALALLLGCIRKIAYKDKRIRSGAWDLQKEQPIHRIRGSTLGLIGFGLIGQALCRKVSGLGLAEVLVHDPFVDSSEIRRAGAEPSGLDTLLKASDYVSIHAPLSKHTTHMIGKPQLALMKRRAILVNTARGPLVDESALYEALESRQIDYAGLDVFEREPLPDENPLRRLDNVILSDHAAWYSDESTRELQMKTARNVAEVLSGKRPTYPVNAV